jgi:hypothetical protein
MYTSLRATALGFVIAALCGIHVASQGGPDPIVGTWELNVAKSKYSSGPGPKSQTRTYAVAADGIKATVNGMDAEGQAITSEWTMNPDGKDRPLTGNPNADTLSIKRIDTNTVEFTLKKAGKVVITGRRTISKDGKTMTLTSKGTNAQGKSVNDVEVFEKK